MDFFFSKEEILIEDERSAASWSIDEKWSRCCRHWTRKLKKGNSKMFSKIYLRVNWRHLFLKRYPVDCFVGLLRCKWGDKWIDLRCSSLTTKCLIYSWCVSVKGTGDNIGEWNGFFSNQFFSPAIQVLWPIFLKKHFYL